MGKREEQWCVKGTYLTILVASHLDSFANGCLRVALDDGTSEGRPAGNNGEYYQTTVSPPKFLPLAINVEWKVLPKDLMYAILQIPDKHEQIENQIAGIWDFDAPPNTVNSSGHGSATMLSLGCTPRQSDGNCVSTRDAD